MCFTEKRSFGVHGQIRAAAKFFRRWFPLFIGAMLESPFAEKIELATALIAYIYYNYNQKEYFAAQNHVKSLLGIDWPWKIRLQRTKPLAWLGNIANFVLHLLCDWGIFLVYFPDPSSKAFWFWSAGGRGRVYLMIPLQPPVSARKGQIKVCRLSALLHNWVIEVVLTSFDITSIVVSFVAVKSSSPPP